MSAARVLALCVALWLVGAHLALGMDFGPRVVVGGALCAAAAALYWWHADQREGRP